MPRSTWVGTGGLPRKIRKREISRKVAEQVESAYMKDPKIGSYIFEFAVWGSWFHLDATQDVGRDKCRLINHSRISPNLLPRSSSNDFKNLPQPASKVGAYGQGRGYDRGYGGGRF